VATRPLFTQRGTGYKFFYTCDGNKNVSEMVHFEQRNGIAAHYDYAPFGAVTRAISASAATDNTFTTDNPFRFSSEYADDALGLVYYNYRHYDPIDGRWCGRDPIEDVNNLNLYLLCRNLFPQYDYLGLVIPKIPKPLPKVAVVPWPEEELNKYVYDNITRRSEIYYLPRGKCCVSDDTGTYGFFKYVVNCQDPNPPRFGTSLRPRRLVLGIIKLVNVKRHCLSKNAYRNETWILDESKGVWLEDVIKKLRPVVTRL
jgi:RHS repeat-associated protein